MRWFAIAPQLSREQWISELFNKYDRKVEWLDKTNQLKNDRYEKSEYGVLLYEARDQEDAYETCRSLNAIYPHLGIILLDQSLSIDIRKAMRSGALDVLVYPIHPDDLDHVIVEREQQYARVKQSGKTTSYMTVCSTKGGVGKTTFSVNLASAYAAQSKSVLVIDLDLQFGDVSMFFDRQPKRSMYEWIKDSSDRMSGPIQPYVESYNEQIDVMPAPLRPEFAEVITPAHVQHLMEKVRGKYDIVIMDTAPYMDDIVLTALEHSDEIYMVTMLDLPTLKNCRLFMETLETLQLKNSLKIVLNRNSKKRGIAISTAEKVLGVPIFLTLPEANKLVFQSVNEGRPYVISHPKAKISRLITKSIDQEADVKRKSAKSKPSIKVVSAGRSN
ncbi:AAA family ATPase [Halobacillus seohaensis]|uniref:AAA family ATPase n=1 Tax=Halobacillus seohaensis TaxID=447421 RepID=A0ABW2ESB3_9BACI